MSAAPKSDAKFSSSILLWVRPDKPRQAGMDRWRGPHSEIISATPGFAEYRQVHLAEDNPGRWPATPGIETAIPVDRKFDGVAEVTLASVLSPLKGRKQNKLAHADEVNIFRRTLLYGGLPGASRWWHVGGGAPAGARTLLYLRRAPGVSARSFRSFVRRELVPALTGAAPLRELRTQTFMRWNRALWDSPGVAHDNPADQHLHASVLLGFADQAARDRFFAEAAPRLSGVLVGRVSAVHAYDVSDTVTFVRDGIILDPPEG